MRQYYTLHAALVATLVVFHAEAFTTAPRLLARSTSLAPAISLRSMASTGPIQMLEQRRNSEEERAIVSRKQLVSGFSALLLGAVLPVNHASAEEKVCENMMGCEQPKNLAPPKRVYKDIFEEERELARQREEAAEKERKEKLQGDFKAMHGQFAAIQKGKNDLERDIKELLAKVKAGTADDATWDDLRRIARLYDTALRKDGMDPTMAKVKKLKLEFDRKAGDEFAKKLNNALKNMDRAGKKKEADTTAACLDEAVAALQGWLALEPKTD